MQKLSRTSALRTNALDASPGVKVARAEAVLGEVLGRSATDHELGRLLEETPDAVRSARKVWFSNYLRAKRLQQSMTLRDLARVTGLTPSALSRFETGQRRPSKETILRLEEALALETGSLEHRAQVAGGGLTEHGVPVQLVEVSSVLIKFLAADPTRLYTLPPRKFEELVAELLDDMGCDVHLTPASRDGGRDILATLSTPFGTLLAIVECKRYAEHHRVGTAIVERFLWTVDRRDAASIGILATTSAFTANARELQQRNSWRLKLKEYDHLVDWLARYGTWKSADNADLWITDKPLSSATQRPNTR